jgi:hypothetical protein
MNRKLLLLLTIGIISANSNAQSNDHQLWLNYAPKVQVNKHFSYGGDIGVRGLISNRDWNQILLRPSVGYRFSRIFSLSGATGIFHTFNRESSDQTELRIHEEVNIRWPDLNIIEIFYRLRIDHRWFFGDANDEDYNTRIRYLFGLETADFRLFGTKTWYIQGIFEGFKTPQDEDASEFFINRSRIHAVLGRRISDRIRLELHYINQKSRVEDIDGLITSQNIYRLRVFQRFGK